MNTITISSNFGRFAYTVTAEITPNVFAKSKGYKVVAEAKDEAEKAKFIAHNAGVAQFRNTQQAIKDGLKQGLANVTYLAIMSSVEKALAKDNDTRNSVAYSAKAAATFTSAVKETLDKIAKEYWLFPVTKFEVTGEHFFNKTAQ